MEYLLKSKTGNTKQKLMLLATGISLYVVGRIAFEGTIITLFIQMTTMLLMGKIIFFLLIFSETSFTILTAASSMPFIDIMELMKMQQALGPIGYGAFWALVSFLTALILTVFAYLWCRYVLLPPLKRRIPTVEDYLLF